MLDLSDLACEAELLSARLRGARCCDALVPCYRCSLLRFNVLARRRVIELPKLSPRSAASWVTGPLTPAGRELRAS